MLTLQINGNTRTLSDLADSTPLADLLIALELKPDRIAVELNGEIAARTQWSSLTVNSGDKLEVVHFVGGGASLL
jgi:sulfur carrier protein